MTLQHGLDVLHVGLGLIVPGLELFHLVGLLFEEAQKTLLLLGGVKVFQLGDQVGDHVPHLAQVLGGNLGQSGLGKIADLLLAGGAILQHLLAVGDVDFLGEGVHHRLFFGAELDLGGGLLGRRFLGGGRGSLFFLHRVQGQAGHSGGVQIKIQSIVCHNDSSFPYSCLLQNAAVFRDLNGRGPGL